MKFNKDILKELLAAIEQKITFSESGINRPGSFSLACHINIEELFKSINNSSIDELKYHLAILYCLDYIHISDGIIDQIAPNGFRFLLYTLYGVECKY